MNLFENPETIKQLRDLLRDPNCPSSDTDLDIDDEPVQNTMANFSKSKPNQLVDEMLERFLLGPGTIGPKTTSRRARKRTTEKQQKESKSSPKELEVDQKPDVRAEKKKSKDPYKQVEEWLEEQEKLDDQILEDRKRPEYTISYKQAVGTEDVYLQMGNKTGSTTSCEDMVIVIKLPEEHVAIEEMSLHVTEDEIDLKTPKYRLKLPLTHKIDPDKGRARYDSETKVLKLTLRMTREFDFVNF